MVNKEDVISVLQTIYDPEFQVDIYNLGMIYDMRILKSDNDNEIEDIEIDLTFTTPACPAAGYILTEMKSKLAGFFNEVRLNVVFDPPWQPSMIKPQGRKKLPPQLISFLDFD